MAPDASTLTITPPMRFIFFGDFQISFNDRTLITVKLCVNVFLEYKEPISISFIYIYQYNIYTEPTEKYEMLKLMILNVWCLITVVSPWYVLLTNNPVYTGRNLQYYLITV
jgi:hypothetical protein